MRNAAAMLYCPNPTCQTPNPAGHQFCQKCSTLLPHQYLWAVGEGAAVYQPGNLVAERYWCQQPRVFLDTKPGFLSSTYRELPEAFLPYLRLTAYPLHIPQVYDWIPAGDDVVAELVLLSQVPLYAVNESPAPLDNSVEPEDFQPDVQLLPDLSSQWQHVSALRQMNWLWQMANLWQPLSGERAASSLFDPDLVRIEGSLLRLLELRFETHQPTLVDLGQQWLSWAKIAQPEITSFVTLLAEGLIQGEIYNSELLVAYLDQGLAQLSRAQTRQIQLATLSDQGPTRQRNEDACYPASGTQTPPLHDAALLIVCDGIGGHQGGDVASHLAITTLEQRLKALDLHQIDSTTLGIELEKAACVANDQISQRNDSEQRFDRQRMGTTVVMALAREHELYIAHVGDSRAYWITRWGCHQVTLDDDVASREVRLGYSFYRQALHQPSAGSLVQALGMGASTLLYPSVQRFIPDEDCIFLLCSDGLSDNDRVEESWGEFLRLLDGKTDLASLSQRLVEIGNTCNGYDNVTVGLIHYQVDQTQSLPMLSELPLITRPIQPITTSGDEYSATQLVTPAAEVAPVTAPPALASLSSTVQIPPTRSAPSRLPLVIGIGVLCGAVGLLIGLLSTFRPPSTPLSRPFEPTPSPALPQQRQPTNQPTPSPSLPLEVGTTIQLSQLGLSPELLPLLVSDPPQGETPSPAAPKLAPPKPVGSIPIGSVLAVLRKQSLSQQENWVELRVCSTPAGNSPESPLPIPTASTPPIEPMPSVNPLSSPVPMVQKGQTGWIEELQLSTQVTPKTNLTPEQRQVCP